MELSTADNPEGNFTDPAEFTIDDNITADTTGVVMQTRNYTCGPAALATLLQNLGINTTEDELADLAETTEDGTTMQGLIKAAKAKGVNLIGVKLNITELRGNMIAYTVSDGEGHYTLIREVTSNTVKLADPTQGNMEIPLEEFQKIYTGYTLTTTNQTETTENTTETENQTNPENQTETEPHINTEKILSNEEMQNIKGKGYGNDPFSSWARYVWHQLSAAGRYIISHTKRIRFKAGTGRGGFYGEVDVEFK